jgi:hypothetical protein
MITKINNVPSNGIEGLRQNGEMIPFLVSHWKLSKKYYLRGENERALRGFFKENVLRFLETQPDMHIESSRGKILIHDKREQISVDEIQC